MKGCEGFYSLAIRMKYSVLVLFLLWFVWLVALSRVKGLKTTGLSYDLGLIESVVALFMSRSGGERVFSTNRESN